MERIKEFIKYLQENGVPIFFIKDPATKSPSVSLTMLVISFSLCVFSLINKAAKVFEGIDVDNSLELLIISSSLYFGRTLSKKFKSDVK
jgi:hypothetical protein